MAARPSRCPQPTIRRPTGVARTSIESDQGFAADGQREPDYRDRDYRDVPTRCRMRLVGEFSPASRSQHSENDSGQRESGDRQDVTALEFWRGDGVVNKNAGRSGGGRGGATPRHARTVRSTCSPLSCPDAVVTSASPTCKGSQRGGHRRRELASTMNSAVVARDAWPVALGTSAGMHRLRSMPR